MIARNAAARWGHTAVWLAALLGLTLHNGAAAAESQLPADARIRYDSARKTVSRIEAKNLLATGAQNDARLADPAAAAIAFIADHRDLFRIAHPRKELRITSVKADEFGFHHVRLSQVYRGLKIAGSEIVLHFDRNTRLYLVTANYIATPETTELRPVLDASAASKAAALAVSMPGQNWRAVLKLWPTVDGRARLAYEVEGSGSVDKSWRVYVDARSGEILDRVPTVSSTALPFPRHTPMPHTR